MKKENYPNLTINLKHLKENYQTIVSRCKALDISVTAVTKGSDSYEHSYNEIAQLALDAGCTSIGDSRINTIIRMRELGFKGETMLLRIPMLSELENLVDYVDISLQSEPIVIEKINRVAQLKNKVHKVILMMDLGDLREGFFDENELINTAIKIEREYKGLHLLGIGTNLGCYGAICPDKVNLTRLVMISKKIEARIQRKLDIISGGATSTLPLVYDKTIPKGINHLRIGEGVLLARDLIDIWKLDMPDLHQDIYTLEAEVIEIKEKPSHPIGTIFIDAFGNTPEYKDIGIRKRALLALGKRDFGALEAIIPFDAHIDILGASSDHLIIDISEYKNELNIGDHLKFHCYYQAMVYANQSQSVYKTYIRD